MHHRLVGGMTLTAALVFAALPVLAQAPPPGPPTPAPELAGLAYFAGDWTCTGKVDATPFGPEHPTQAKVSVKKQFGGFWLVGRFTEQKTKANPVPMSFEFIQGYDAAAKALTMDGYDTFGNRSHQTTAGWKDTTLVYEGQSTGPDGKSSPARDTFVKKSDSTMEHDGEFQLEPGKWAHIDHETCKRVQK